MHYATRADGSEEAIAKSDDCNDIFGYWRVKRKLKGTREAHPPQPRAERVRLLRDDGATSHDDEGHAAEAKSRPIDDYQNPLR
jgi:hypothetical protein